MPAYQIQVRGTLDGATAFAIPSPLPQPDNGGVIKIDAGVAVNVGTFDLNSLVFTDSAAVWLRAVQVEFAAATRAARFQLTIPGSRIPRRIIPDLESVDAAPLMRVHSLQPNIIAPVGSILTVLTDNANDTFAGAPVAGPHFVYFDIEPIRGDRDLGLIGDLSAFSDAKSRSQGATMRSFQAAAATLTTEIGVVAPPAAENLDVGLLPVQSPQMQVQQIRVTNGAIAAAGESMTVAVNQVVVGTGAVNNLGTFVIDATVAANSISVIPIERMNNQLSVGDRIQVVRTYVAGMAPTPMTNTLVEVDIRPVGL